MKERNRFKADSGRILTGALLIWLVALLFFMPVTCVLASEEPAPASDDESLTGELMQLTEATNALSAPDDNADVVVSLPAGAFVMTINERDGWYEIFYQGETLYIASDAQTTEDPYKNEVAKEMETQAQSDGLYMESLETQTRAQRSMRLWRGVIGVLLVAMAALAIVALLRKKE